MRAKEFISEGASSITIPEPKAADPKSVTDPKAPGELLNQMKDIANMPVPAVKETKK